MRRYQVEHIPAPEPEMNTYTRDTYRERERAKWGSRPEFFVTLVAMVANISVLETFPYYCYIHGGVIFLVPYVLFLLLFTVPLMVMETALGQYAGVSAITMWRACPLFKGVGFAVLLTILLVTSLEGVSLAWTLYYIFSSASSKLPWKDCINYWNTGSCLSPFNTLQTNHSSSGNSPGYEFWMYGVLQPSMGIEDLGGVNIPLIISLAAAWVIIILILCAGPRSLGKVLYIVVITPFLLLVVLLIRGLTLPGSFGGLLNVAKPDIYKFLVPGMWLDGCKHAFFTFAAGLAVTTTMASYNRVDYNSYRDVLLLPIVALVVNVMGAAVVFAFIGYLSKMMNRPIGEFVLSGAELSFVTMAEAVAHLPISQLWSALYFVLDLTLKLGSQVVLIQVLASSISDDISGTARRCWARFSFLILICAISCMIGVPCVTRGGIYVFHLIDMSAVRFGPYVCAIFQCIGIAWVYGMEQVYEDMTLLRGHRPCGLWKAFWCFFCPLLPLAMMVYQMVMYRPMTYTIASSRYVYPMWAKVVSWLVSLLPVLLILLGMVFQLARFSGKNLREVVKPTEAWGPVEGRQRQRQCFVPSAPPATGTMEMKPPPYVEYERAWAY